MAMTHPGAADLLEVEVPVGGRVLVVGDLHLPAQATTPSALATAALAQTIDAWTGPGVLIFNGSCLELLAAGGCPSAANALNAHPKLVAAVQAFAAGAGRRVLYLPGARDGRASWDPGAAGALHTLLGAEIALAAELHINTGAGPKTVRVEPGHRFDPLTCPTDPRNPADSPFGQHLVCEVLPALRDSGSAGGRENGAADGDRSGRRRGWSRRKPPGEDWLAGLDSLDDAAAFPRFLASRLIYRRLGRHAWWLLLPLIAAVLLRLPFAVVRRAHSHVGSASRVGVYLVIATLVELLVITAVVAALIRGSWRALAGVALSRGGPERNDPNAAARGWARDRVTAGNTGVITSHTRHPEFTRLGEGFYGNTGCASEVVSESPARLDAVGMPSLFLAHQQVSWVELEAGNELHARLLHARRDLPGASLFERLLTKRAPENRIPESADGSAAAGRAARRSPAADLRPDVVATFPQGGSWPEPVDVAHRLRRVRRWSAGLVGAAGLLSLVSAFVAPMRPRLSALLELVPLAVPQAADALVALSSLGLLVLARSIRRGQRRAWLICEALLVGGGVLHLVKGVDVEEALIAAAVAGYLFFHRDAFKAGVDRPSTRRAIMTLGYGTAITVLAGTIGVEMGTMLSRSRHHQRLPLPQAFVAASERLVGQHSVALPDRVQDFVAPSMLALAIGLALAAAYLLSRPVVARAAHAGGASTGPGPRSGQRAPGDRASAVSRGGGPGGGGAGPAAGAGSYGLGRAREIVRRHGSGTLDYFALRDDKQLFFWGDTLVAYGVYGGVCLVSPDPIGPQAERDEGWKAFRHFADERGWTLAVMGAGEQWLPIYRASGMHDLYVGDEAVVDCNRFTLDGGRYKGLRQAVNRVAKYGYTITFHDPSELDAGLRAQLESVMTKSRRGDVERGFSMTLGRAFDPSDDGLLLAVVWGPPAGAGDTGPTWGAGDTNGKGGGPANGKAADPANGKAADPANFMAVAPGSQTGVGQPVAFCQYVPAPGIQGFSLDLMRRDNGDHPNGLLDFAVVETIRHLKRNGYRGLGLNFATMRAVLAGEAGEGLSQKIQAWLLRRMSDSMQIESLWRFNAKYDPDWQPRYALYDSPESALPAAIAVARAESFWELPVIGRFLVPDAPPVDRGGQAAPAAPADQPAPAAQPAPEHLPT